MQPRHRSHFKSRFGSKLQYRGTSIIVLNAVKFTLNFNNNGLSFSPSHTNPTDDKTHRTHSETAPLPSSTRTSNPPAENFSPAPSAVESPLAFRYAPPRTPLQPLPIRLELRILLQLTLHQIKLILRLDQLS